MANIGNDDRQRAIAGKFSQIAMTAVEHALPRGTRYVVIIQGPDFNTYGANVAEPDTVEMLRGLLGALQESPGFR
jgi:hypothetical protein